jgi:branched-chain amino acid transport system ATP-binding protein
VEILTVRDARIHFGGVRALDGVSLEIEEGSSCGIFGPNGSGKTTVLGAISRLTPLTSGELLFEGTNYTNAPGHVPCQLGIVRTFQSVRLLPGMSVVRNVMIGAASKRISRSPTINWLNVLRTNADERIVRKQSIEALERVGIIEYAKTLPEDLPYGLQRRVELARALATGPKLLLLDEPMAGMNRSERSTLADLLITLKSDGITIVLVEHDLAMIHRVCDTSYALDFGRVIGAGPPREVATLPAVQEAYLGHSLGAKGVTAE